MAQVVNLAFLCYCRCSISTIVSTCLNSGSIVPADLFNEGYIASDARHAFCAIPLPFWSDVSIFLSSHFNKLLGHYWYEISIKKLVERYFSCLIMLIKIKSSVKTFSPLLKKKHVVKDDIISTNIINGKFPILETTAFDNSFNN